MLRKVKIEITTWLISFDIIETIKNNHDTNIHSKF